MSSFTSKVKAELCHKLFSDDQSSAILCAFFSLSSKIKFSQDNKKFFALIKTSHPVIAKLVYKLLKQIGDGKIDLNVNINHRFGNNTKQLIISYDNASIDILNKFELIKQYNKLSIEPNIGKLIGDATKRAFIAGVFLATGSISSPTSMKYHLEIQLPSLSYAENLKVLLNSFGLSFFLMKRRHHFFLYLKKSGEISDFLKLIDAQQALYYFEDKIIQREMTNKINRWNNVDLYNEQKIISAAVSQSKIIAKLKNSDEWQNIKPRTKIIANLRLKNPNASFNELTLDYYKLTGKEISKSSVNHAFRELRQTYDKVK